MIRALFRIAALALVAYALGFAIFAVTLPRPAAEERTDAVVVLTGGSGRLERGFDVLKRRLAGRMLISGVDRRVKAQELALAYGVEPSLMACCVTLERDSYDTRSNADEVARWVARRRVRSIRLVTNDLHMPRAHYELRKQLGGDLPVVVDAVPTNPNLEQIHLEYFKYLLGRAADLIGI